MSQPAQTVDTVAAWLAEHAVPRPRMEAVKWNRNDTGGVLQTPWEFTSILKAFTTGQ
jgi:hypothetical protein